MERLDLRHRGGNPFADPQWIPVLDLCELECKETEICVENDELTQKCKKLPEECIQKLEMIKQVKTTPKPMQRVLVSRTRRVS
ncbi:hypothetical protein M3Y97_01041100 [Aphelenchoides bicaudatus]|nr:hypothetical protein M3Y97_01152000 [Aphelenchoides bicaudatus]KAI6171407.1 hypothetical protein M3Y97_01041100 [Aphelenchoides bicaudatus]